MKARFGFTARRYPIGACSVKWFDRLITSVWHPGDVPRGILADIVEDLGISRDDFYFKKF
ncbi:MAG TPA: hypothetical protein VED19_00520 [Candidatus Nitrosopolaris sp.]|nr:hypothetical protein [Candidatus Nitrosopolaris sp.]